MNAMGPSEDKSLTEYYLLKLLSEMSDESQEDSVNADEFYTKYRSSFALIKNKNWPEIVKRLMSLVQRGFIELRGHRDPATNRWGLNQEPPMVMLVLTHFGEDALELGPKDYKQAGTGAVDRSVTFSGTVNTQNLATGDNASQTSQGHQIQSLNLQVSLEQVVAHIDHEIQKLPDREQATVKARWDDFKDKLATCSTAGGFLALVHAHAAPLGEMLAKFSGC